MITETFLSGSVCALHISGGAFSLVNLPQSKEKNKNNVYSVCETKNWKVKHKNLYVREAAGTNSAVI